MLSLYHRASSYSQLGNQKLALADLDRVIEIDPNFMLSYCTRAKVRQQLRDPKGASADMQKCNSYKGVQSQESRLAKLDQSINTSPKPGLLYCARARVRQQMGDSKGASTDTQKCKSLEPLDTRKTALANLNNAIAANPENKLAHCLRAKVHQDLGASKEAKADNQQCQGPLIPDDIRKHALMDLNQAIAADPEPGWLYCSRAKVRQQVGDLKGARADSQKCKSNESYGDH